MTPPEAWDKFFENLGISGVVKTAAEVSGVGYRTVYNHIDMAEAKDATEESREWYRRYLEAKRKAVDTLIAEAFRRAVEGTREPLIGRVGKDQDGIVTHVTKYSDTLLNLLLRAGDPSRFRDRVSTELTGKDGGPIKTETKVIAVPAIEDGAPE